MMGASRGFGPPVGGGSVATGRGEATAKRWQRLAWCWAVYYCCVMTVGRFPEYTQAVIWMGGLVVGLLTLRLLSRRMSDVPSEAGLLGALAAWSILGGFDVADGAAYLANLKLLLECLFVVALLGAVVRNSGDTNSMWWAFLAVAVFNTGYVLDSGVELGMGGLAGLERQAGVTGNANALGFCAFAGLLGAMAIFGETKSILARALCLAGSVVALVGLLMGGSRGAYLAWVVSVILWSITCFGGARNRAWKVALGAVIAGAVLYPATGWIQENTGLGKRMTGAVSREDASSEIRLELSIIGAKLALEHPLTGVGLGQFGLVTGTGLYAHNEWAEFAATTGVPGFLLVLGVYFSVWRRLSRVIGQRRSALEIYRARMARLTLIILVVSGAVFRPNLISVDTMFLLAVVVGVGNRAVGKR
jgi:O-antigen ligase